MFEFSYIGCWIYRARKKGRDIEMGVIWMKAID